MAASQAAYRVKSRASLADSNNAGQKEEGEPLHLLTILFERLICLTKVRFYFIPFQETEQ